MEKNDIKVSFTILVHNEDESLQKLLDQLNSIKTIWDEVIIVHDTPCTNPKTIEILEKYKSDSVYVYERSLNGDFASQKNFADSKCTNPYIFNIDADELLDSHLSTSFREIIFINQDVEYFRLPRVNKVSGIELSNITQWNWNISQIKTEIEESKLNESQELFKLLKLFNLIISENNGMFTYYTPIINWPDLQGRIYKRLPNILWQNKVHEFIVGYKKYANFPLDKKFSLLHYKTIDNQIKQNNFYSGL